MCAPGTDVIDRLTAAARPPLAEWIGQHRALVLTAVKEGGPAAWRALAEEQVEKTGQPSSQTMPLSWALKAFWVKFFESESWWPAAKDWLAEARAKGSTDAKLLKELKNRLAGFPGNGVRFDGVRGGDGDYCYVGFPDGSDECKLQHIIVIRRGAKGWRVPVQYQFTRDEVLQVARDTLGIGMPKGKVGSKPKDKPTSRAVGNPARYVYVIELDPKVLDHEKHSLNPHAEPGSTCVYVGQTGLDPKERFAVHKRRGVYSSFLVADYGRRLFPRYSGPGSTEEEAEREERTVAERLRKEGFYVFGGH